MRIPFHTHRIALFALWVPFVIWRSSAFAQAASDSVIPAVILKVEGDGIANVRKRSGVVESAGARGKLFVGDRVITDAHSTAYLMLNDGSLLKVGFNSEFTLEKVENRQRYLSWFFRLVRGSIRALIEKIPAQEMHFRVETQNAILGVRGSEFLLDYDGAKGSSSLFMLGGQATYGASGCEKALTCIDVHDGEAASLLGDGTKPSVPARYNMKDLFAVEQSAVPGANANARLSLFREARRASWRAGQTIEEGALKKILDDATVELAASQDRAVGRTKAQREAMHEAIKNGTYESAIAAADAYASAQGIFNPGSNGGAENLVAQVVAAKFRLGDAVKAADAAGLFLDKPTRPSDGAIARSYKLRKEVDYDQSIAAKGYRQTLVKSEEDYMDTLSYAEALAASQVPAGDTPNGDKPTSVPSKAAACDGACENARIAHEVDVASEGSVTAFQRLTPPLGVAADAVPSKRGKGGLPGSIKTLFFKRTVPGNSCYRTQSKCTMRPCTGSGMGKKCRAGEMVQVCDSRQIPVRCDDE